MSGEDDGKRTMGQELKDAINPLWHLPLIGTFARWATGKKLSDDAKLIGGTVWLPGIGGGAALVDTHLKNTTGMDLTDNLLVRTGLKDASSVDTTQVGSSSLSNAALKIPGVSEVTGAVSGVVSVLPSAGGMPDSPGKKAAPPRGPQLP